MVRSMYWLGCAWLLTTMTVSFASAQTQTTPQGGNTMQAEVVAYGGWNRCLRLTNGQIELLVTADVGPRVIRFGFLNGPNEFVEFAEDMGKTGGDTWRPYGGHRLWHAPEAKPRTYAPDNAPVQWAFADGELQVTQPVEASTGIQKQLFIRMDPAANRVQVRHRLTNKGLWPVTLAPWALSMMAPGGRVIVPQEEFRSHSDWLLPARPLVMWHYTNLADPRWTLSARYVQLRQDPGMPNPQKFGTRVTAGWAAYHNGDRVFLKRFGLTPDATYPDYGCNAEFFTNDAFLEVESLGPVVTLEPDAAVDHEETWYLFKGVTVGATDDAIDAAMTPLLQQSAR